MSNFHATFKIKFSDLIYIYLDTKIIAKCQKKEQLKVLYSNLLPPLKYGMVTQEGAALFSWTCDRKFCHFMLRYKEF